MEPETHPFAKETHFQHRHFWVPCYFLGIYILVVSLEQKLVGGFNPVEKYSSNWIISPSRGVNFKKMKPTPRKIPFLPEESWDLKTGGLEIPDPCYAHPNPAIGGSNDS